MKSPITGKKMDILSEVRRIDFNGKIIEVLFYYYICVDSGERFTSTLMDEINRIYNQQDLS